MEAFSTLSPRPRSAQYCFLFLASQPTNRSSGNNIYCHGTNGWLATPFELCRETAAALQLMQRDDVQRNHFTAYLQVEIKRKRHERSELARILLSHHDEPSQSSQANVPSSTTDQHTSTATNFRKLSFANQCRKLGTRSHRPVMGSNISTSHWQQPILESRDYHQRVCGCEHVSIHSQAGRNSITSLSPNTRILLHDQLGRPSNLISFLRQKLSQRN